MCRRRWVCREKTWHFFNVSLFGKHCSHDKNLFTHRKNLVVPRQSRMVFHYHSQGSEQRNWLLFCHPKEGLGIVTSHSNHWPNDLADINFPRQKIRRLSLANQSRGQKEREHHRKRCRSFNTKVIELTFRQRSKIFFGLQIPLHPWQRVFPSAQHFF